MRIDCFHPTDDHELSFVLEGSDLQILTRKKGKERSRTKAFDDSEKARVGAEKALRSKLKAGFVLARDLPHPGLFDAPSPDRIRWVLKAKNLRKDDLLINQLPVCYEPLVKSHGRRFIDGPDGYGVVLRPQWHVVHSGKLTRVTPELRGQEHTRYPLVHRRHPKDATRRTLLFVDGDSLRELDLETATHQEVFAFPSGQKHSLKLEYLCYGYGDDVLYVNGSIVMAIDRRTKTERQGFDAKEPIRSFCRLTRGRTAVRVRDHVLILGPDWAVQQRLHGGTGFAMGTWLDGRMLMVSGRNTSPTEPRTVVFAVRPEGLAKILSTSLSILQTYDLRGAQWMTLESHDHEWEEGFCQESIPYGSRLRKRGPLRVLGLEAAWADPTRPFQEAGPT